MSEHRVQINWKAGSEEFKTETYDRTHTLHFEGGQTLNGSAAPDFYGRAEYANPEEMLAASLASCHKLTFLAVAAKMRLPVAEYTDSAVATLEKNAEGRMAVTKVVLRPKVTFQDNANAPDASKLEGMHRKAHSACMIANSVKTEVTVEPG